MIQDTCSTLPKYFVNYEIIVVDDGSTDSTGAIADELAREIDFIKVLHQSNGGYGVALVAGINLATKEFAAKPWSPGNIPVTIDAAFIRVTEGKTG